MKYKTDMMVHSTKREGGKTIDWKDPKVNIRLIAAMVAAQGGKVNYTGKPMIYFLTLQANPFTWFL
jgi:hypothetical protein